MKTSKRHKSAAHDRRFRQGMGLIERLPGFRKIALGHRRCAGHGRRAGVIEVKSVEAKALRVTIYGLDGFLQEAAVYVEDAAQALSALISV